MRRKRVKDFSRVVGILQKGGHYFPSNDKSEEKIEGVKKLLANTDYAQVADGLLTKPFWDRDDFQIVKTMLESFDMDVMVFYSPLNR